VHWTALQAGECFDFRKEASQEINDVNVVSCAESHHYEAFWIGAMPAGDWPTDAAATAFFDQTCIPAFDTYVGLDYDSSRWYAYWLAPAESAWAEGERTFLCYIGNATDTAMTGAAQGSQE
jgi:hypothetical protein